MSEGADEINQEDSDPPRSNVSITWKVWQSCPSSVIFVGKYVLTLVSFKITPSQLADVSLKPNSFRFRTVKPILIAKNGGFCHFCATGDVLFF